MRDGLAQRRESAGGRPNLATTTIVARYGPLSLSVEVLPDELRALVVASLSEAAPEGALSGLSVRVQVDIARDPASPLTQPADGQWDVWGPTPAWDASVTYGAHGIFCRFSFDPTFVSGLSRSKTAALDALWKAALRMIFAVAAPFAGALLVHGAALVPTEGQGAFAFIGPSGSGKTTMASRLPDWTRVSDDTLLLWRADDFWYVSGTPLQGREKNPVLVGCFPVRALVALKPNAVDLVVRPSLPSEAFQALIARTFFYPSSAVPEGTADRLIEAIYSLSQALPMFELQSNLDHSIEGPLLAVGGPHV